MTKGPSCDVEEVTNLVQNAIQESTCKETRTTLIYNLPVSQVSSFPDLLSKLNEQKNKMEVFNIGLKVTTMEDVFLKYVL